MPGPKPETGAKSNYAFANYRDHTVAPSPYASSAILGALARVTSNVGPAVPAGRSGRLDKSSRFEAVEQEAVFASYRRMPSGLCAGLTSTGPGTRVGLAASLELRLGILAFTQSSIGDGCAPARRRRRQQRPTGGVEIGSQQLCLEYVLGSGRGSHDEAL